MSWIALSSMHAGVNKRLLLVSFTLFLARNTKYRQQQQQLYLNDFKVILLHRQIVSIETFESQCEITSIAFTGNKTGRGMDPKCTRKAIACYNGG